VCFSRLVVAFVLVFLQGLPLAWGQETKQVPAKASIRIDRAMIRFESNELGGSSRPRFIFERVLVFEARLEALFEEQRGIPRHPNGYHERDIRSALERHVTEEILVNLPIYPALSTDEVRRRFIATLVSLQQGVGGRKNLLDAAYAEGLEMEEVNAFIERRARASLYLDRMVAPMLNPSDATLREVLRTESTPFRDHRFEDVAQDLRQWYVADRLRTALAAFFRSARARIRIVVLDS
jgi:hypothetical protein